MATASFSRAFTQFALKLAIAKAMVMVANLCIARHLDTAHFGRLAIVLAIGNYWCLPFFTCWGLAYVRFASRQAQEESCREYLTGTLVCIALAVSIILPIQIIFRQEFSDFLNMSTSTWVYGCLFGILMGSYYFSKSIFQAKEKWSLYIASEFLFAISLTIGVILLYMLNSSRNFFNIIFILTFSHLLGSMIGLFEIKPAIKSPKLTYVNQVAYYGIGLFVSFGLSLMGMQLDKILLNSYSDTITIGRYQAYYISTYGILSSFSIIFNNYLLPAYGKHGQRTVQGVLQRILLLATLPMFTGCLLAGRLAFHLLGDSFGFLWSELAWASVFSVAAFWLQTEVFFSMTLGKKQLAVNSLAYATFIGIQFLTMPHLIRTAGVIGAYQGMTAASLAGLLIVYSAITISLKRGAVCANGIQCR